MRLTTQIRDGYTVVTREYPMAGCYETHCRGLEEELGVITATTESEAEEAHEDMIENVKIWLEGE